MVRSSDLSEPELERLLREAAAPVAPPLAPAQVRLVVELAAALHGPPAGPRPATGVPAPVWVPAAALAGLGALVFAGCLAPAPESWLQMLAIGVPAANAALAPLAAAAIVWRRRRMQRAA